MLQGGSAIFWMIVGLSLVGVMLTSAVFALLFRKAGPNEALVVYGFRGTRIVIGRGTVVLPMIETHRLLSLELMSFEVAPQQDLVTSDGLAVTVETVAQVKVKSEPEFIMKASNLFLSKTRGEREDLIRSVIEGHLRNTVGQFTVEQLVTARRMVADRVLSACADDMNKMGLEIVLFSIRGVRDKKVRVIDMGGRDRASGTRHAAVAADEAHEDTVMRQRSTTS